MRPSRSIPTMLLGAALLPIAGPLMAQTQAVEDLALVLEAEDSRRWDGPLFSGALNHPEPSVRRLAARAVGRIGDWRGTPLLLPLLLDPDTTVQTTSMFALGLLGDTAAVADIIDRLRASPAIGQQPAIEGVAALAKIGGPRAAAFLGMLLRGGASVTVADPAPLIAEALTNGWRLGDEAPLADLLNYAGDPAEDLRWRSVYSLARLRAPDAGELFLRDITDKSPLVRAAAASALTRRYVTSSGLERATCTGLLLKATTDQTESVRISALRALGTYRSADLTEFILPALDDPEPNVRVQAARALGATGGIVAAPDLARLVTEDKFFALGREALIALSRIDSAAFVGAAGAWSDSGDWRRRAVAARGWARIAPGFPPGSPQFLDDPDGRVRAAALGGWSATEREPSAPLVSRARRMIADGDPVVRVEAAGVLGRHHSPQDVGALVSMFLTAAHDPMPDASWAALDALLSIEETSDEGHSQVIIDFLGRVPTPRDYRIRLWAEDNWPAAADRWGGAYPIETGWSLQDYRAVVERFLVNQGEAYPHVTVETETNGTLEIELFGPDAPLTVQRFLGLVDRRFFDGMQWHRVVPDYVIQAGDPRGDGWGVAPGAIRDEINQRRYRTRYVGVALSGPDTGSSQWFITLSPQPRLDGTYTVFGRLVGPSPGLRRITQGDRIRTIRR